MVKLTKRTRDEMLSETHTSAVSFYEDLEHLKSVVEKSETRAVDIRHASSILRRWLIEGALKRVANPRIGRIKLLAIDNTPVYRACRTGKINNFISGGASVHGIFLMAGMITEGASAAALENFHPGEHIALALDSFLRQRVIFTQNTWLTRAQVIKYVANVDQGVHDGQIKEPWEKLLAEFRQQVTVQLIDNATRENTSSNLQNNIGLVPTISWNIGAPAEKTSMADYDPRKINGVLLELLATMHFLVMSDDLKKLYAFVAQEHLGS